MADITDIRAGLALNLSAIPDLQVSAYVLSSPTFPTALILAGPTEYDRAFQRGLDGLMFRVRVLLAAVDDIGAGTNLDAYMAGSGARSVKAAVEADRTLAGAAQSLQVTGHEGEVVYVLPDGTAALGAEWTVEVIALGTS